jgi:hypothetical protein
MRHVLVVVARRALVPPIAAGCGKEPEPAMAVVIAE